MTKDFDSWNEVKKNINSDYTHPTYREREVWWCSIGTNVGFEEDGKGPTSSRPVLIIKGFNRQLCWIIPLSRSVKNNPYYLLLKIPGDKNASAMLSQLRPIDTRRLSNKIGLINEEEFQKTKQALMGLFK